jgi:ferritin-like metal-binding protein YciE
MAIQTLDELFRHELSFMYALEQQHVETLTRLCKDLGEARDAAEVRQAREHESALLPIRRHLEETRGQVALLDRCFEHMGHRPRKATPQAARGLLQDYDAVVRLGPEPDLLALHAVAAAARIEQLEVAAYRTLVEQAALLRQREAAAILRELLRQERHAAQALERVWAALAKELAASSGTT